MEDEKRRFIRFPYKMRSELNVKDKIYSVNELNNLSIGSCLLEIEENLDSSTSCALKIMLGNEADQPAINVEGVIVRCKDGETAIKFTSIDPESLRHLQAVARYNSADPERVEKEIKEHPGII